MVNNPQYSNLDMPLVGSDTQGETGVGLTKEVIGRELEYAYRELPTSDYGIDGQMEITEVNANGKRYATGRILSTQIKTSFDHETATHWIFYIRKQTVNYWNQHSIPVILIYADINNRVCYWARADSTNHQENDKSYSVAVPKNQIINSNTHLTFCRLAENTTKLGRGLALILPYIELMKQLADGQPVSVDVEDWINKSSGRKRAIIGTYGDESTQELTKKSEVQTIGYDSPLDMVNAVLPWATAIPDERVKPTDDELYDEYLEQEGWYDSEEGRYVDLANDFEDWARGRNEFDGAYGSSSGEVVFYRFSLRLNDLGESFLSVFRHFEGMLGE